MAGIRQPIEDVINRLSTIELPNGQGNIVPVYCALYNHQDRDIENQDTYSFPLPAIFVELLNPNNFLSIGGAANMYAADITWVIHLLHEQYDSGTGTMDQNLDVFDQFRDKVLAQFSLFAPTACGPLSMIGENPDFDHTNICHPTLHFRCHYIDSRGSWYDPASGHYIYTTPPTDVEIDITKGQHSDFDDQETSFKQPYIIPQNGS